MIAVTSGQNTQKKEGEKGERIEHLHYTAYTLQGKTAITHQLAKNIRKKLSITLDFCTSEVLCVEAAHTSK